MSEYKIRILTPEQAIDLFATKGELAAVVAGENGGGGVAVWGSIIGVLSGQPDLQAALDAKQFQLTAGDGIAIDTSDPDSPVISVTETGGGAWGEITGTLSSQTDLQAALNAKQSTMTLVAGTGVSINQTTQNAPIISVELDTAPSASTTAVYTTASLLADAREQGSVTISPLYVMSHVAVNKPARVRIYNTTAQQTADLTRPRGTDPDPDIDHGIILDFALTASGSRYLSPLVVGSDVTPTGLPITVDNIDTTTGPVTVTITYWDLSAATIVGGGSSGGPVELDEYENATITTGTDTAHLGVDEWGYATLAGHGATARNTSGSAYGDNATANGYNSSAYGNSASAMGEDSSAYGDYSEAQGAESGAFGSDSKALGEKSFATSGGVVSAPFSAGILNTTPVIHTERTVLGVRDLEIKRGTGSSRDPFGNYSGPGTGIILADSSGAKWRISVSTSGVVSAVADTSPTAPVGITLQSSAGLYQNWNSINTNTTGQYAIASRYSGNLYTTANYGATWTARTAAGSRSWGDTLISADGQTMLASYPTGMYKSTDAGANWTNVAIPTVSGATWTSLSGSYTLGSIIIAVGGQIYKSTNLGTTWTPIFTSFTDNMWTMTAMSGDGTSILAANRNGGTGPFCWAIRSTNSGVSFETLPRMPYAHGHVNSISLSETGEYALWPALFGQVMYSSDIGDDFYAMADLGAGRWNATALSADGNTAMAIDSYQGGAYLSDGGIYYMSYLQASAAQDWKHLALASNGLFAYLIDGNGINGYTITP